jgi:RNAse (barnase) inhibitor barstar
LSYENNFIAAVKGSELIREWLDVMMEWIQLPFDIVWKEMENV